MPPAIISLSWFHALTAGLSLVWDFRRLTGPAYKSIERASLEAARLGHRDLGSEHLLLGMLKTEGTSAQLVLQQLGVSTSLVLSHIENMVWNVGQSRSGKRCFTENFIRCVKLGRRVADEHGRHFTGTEHLLLGMLKEGHGVGATLLSTYEVTYDSVAAAVSSLLWIEPPQRAG